MQTKPHEYAHDDKDDKCVRMRFKAIFTVMKRKTFFYRTVSFVAFVRGPFVFTIEYLEYDISGFFRLPPIIVVTLLPFADNDRLKKISRNVSRNCRLMPQ